MQGLLDCYMHSRMCFRMTCVHVRLKDSDNGLRMNGTMVMCRGCWRGFQWEQDKMKAKNNMKIKCLLVRSGTTMCDASSSSPTCAVFLVLDTQLCENSEQHCAASSSSPTCCGVTNQALPKKDHGLMCVTPHTLWHATCHGVSIVVAFSAL